MLVSNIIFTDILMYTCVPVSYIKNDFNLKELYYILF